ncbi:MAG: Fur family transcriptional regulator [Cytophagaceae bacterium]
MARPQQDIKEMLREHNLKVTDQREQVLKVFLAKNKVLQLSEINKSISKDFDRITLYRTLNTFEQHGLIHKIPDKSGNATYALCRHDSVNHNHDDNHVHFKCTSCNVTLCLEDVEIPPIRIPKKFTAEKFNFLIEGRCEKCATKN